MESNVGAVQIGVLELVGYRSNVFGFSGVLDNLNIQAIQNSGNALSYLVKELLAGREWRILGAPHDGILVGIVGKEPGGAFGR